MVTPVLEKPSPSPIPLGDTTRFVAIRANLMPDDVIRARAAERMRRRVLTGLVVVVALLIGWYGLSWWQTSTANSDLSDAQRQSTALQSQTNQFAALVKAQSDTQVIQGRLQKLMVGDLSWKSMLSTLRAQAPRGITLTQVSGTVTAGAAGAGTVGGAAAAPGGYDALNISGKAVIGTITIAGTGTDQRSVAAYADKLSTVKGLAAPSPTSVTAAGKTVTFGLTVLVTSDALGGRYAMPVSPTVTPGGK